MEKQLPVFPSSTVKFICVSDTHNDDPRASVPDGDIFIHAGDMTDHATISEYEAVLDWIGSLPHKVKVMVAGNRDNTLDPKGKKFSQEALDLLTSDNLKERGIHYLDREVRTVAYYTTITGEQKAINIYGNPLQPIFFGNLYPFTYSAHSASESSAAWASAPKPADGVQIWVTHGPPRHRLDLTTDARMTGCETQAKAVASAKPLLCVFGHYHYSWGVEHVRWEERSDDIAEATVLTLSEERRQQEGLDGPETRNAFDFGKDGEDAKLVPGKETVFVNAAWMTGKKRQVDERNQPIAVTLTF